MGVPTMYTHLLSSYGEKEAAEKLLLQEAAQRMRLFVCGSSACPISIMKQWRDVSGHWLLERYGMTEIGMALSNPLHVISSTSLTHLTLLQGERRPGYVGAPLSGVSVKVTSTDGAFGELCVKGPTVFSEYWGNAEATAEAFDTDGYFKTGDMVIEEGDPPYYRMMGRLSADIIKSGGYKLSAIEIENALLEHPAVRECSVLGMPDDVYGEIIVAVIRLCENDHPSDEDLLQFCRGRLAKYKLPRRLIRLDTIPRNALGKVNKNELRFHIEKRSSVGDRHSK